MAASISEIKVVPSETTKLKGRINWLYPTLMLVIFFSFFQLGKAPVKEWGEAYWGISAIEMLNYGDWMHLYNGGESKQIRAQPPLVIWMIASNFSLFGYSAFSLRLHSAIATLFIFFFIYRIIQLYRPPLFAFTVCLILLSVHGIIGFHVGRSGDPDAVLVAFLLAGLYFFLRYLDFMRYHDIYIAAVLWGLAFWTKGPAFAIFFPGLLLYMALDGRLRHVLRLREIYKAAGILLLFPLTWYLIVHFFGQLPAELPVGMHHTFERMFLDDLTGLFASTPVDGETEHADPLFLWHLLRENFRHWDLIFYVVILSAIGRKIVTGLPKWEPLQYRLLLLSVCLWLPLALFLSLATTSRFWHFAPAIPFIAITTVTGIWWLYQRYPKITLSAFSIFLLFCLYTRYIGTKPEIADASQSTDLFTQLIDRQEEPLQRTAKIYQVGSRPAERVLLELYFANPKVISAQLEKVLADNTQDLLLFIRRQDWQNSQKDLGNFTITDEDEHYLILEKN